MTAMPKVVETSAVQPAGAVAEGAVIHVTAWGKGEARTTAAAAARRARVDFMAVVFRVYRRSRSGR